MVHPDLFGKFPEQRAINENSLQILSAHLETLQRRTFTSSQSGPSSLPFYLRDKSKPFRLVKVPLGKQRDTKTFVISILKICELSVEKIEKLSSTPTPPKRQLSDFHQAPGGIKYSVDDTEGQFSEEFDLFQFKVRQARQDETLEKFIRKNIDLAQIRTKSLDDLKEEVQKLKADLKTKLKLADITYNCGWNFEHFRGCLKSLEKLHDLYADEMHNLHSKRVTFSQFTGVSLDGDIHLFTGDVQNNWLDVSSFVESKFN